MRKVARRLIIIAILLSGTQIIELPWTGLSFFQISLILAIVVSLLEIIFAQKIRLEGNIGFAIVFGISSVLAFFTSTYQSWAKSYLLLGLMTAALVLIIPFYFGINDIRLLEKTLIRSQYIVYPFSIYSLYMFYVRGGVPQHISLLGGLYINLDADFIKRAQASAQIRLTLPYSTPPVLSIVMSMCVIILLVDKQLFSKLVRILLIGGYFIVLLLTNSRTGLVALVIFEVLYVVAQKKVPQYVERKLVLSIAIIGGIAALIIMKIYRTDFFRAFALRLQAMRFSELIENRHLWVPLDGLILWLSSFKRFVLGIGFGSSYNLMGAHTYLPPYFLNSFVTLCAERGVLGLLIVIYLIRLGTKIFRFSFQCKSEIKAISFAMVVGLISCFFYEAINCYFLIFTIAISYIIDSYANCEVR